jgi:hypothetical protein
MKNFYQPPNQRMRKIKEEKNGSEKNSNFEMTMHESFDFKGVWSFNHPHLSVKDCLEKLCRVEVLVKRGGVRILRLCFGNKFVASLGIYKGKTRREACS